MLADLLHVAVMCLRAFEDVHPTLSSPWISSAGSACMAVSLRANTVLRSCRISAIDQNACLPAGCLKLSITLCIWGRSSSCCTVYCSGGAGIAHTSHPRALRSRRCSCLGAAEQRSKLSYDPGGANSNFKGCSYGPSVVPKHIDWDMLSQLSGDPSRVFILETRNSPRHKHSETRTQHECPPAPIPWPVQLRGLAGLEHSTVVMLHSELEGCLWDIASIQVVCGRCNPVELHEIGGTLTATVTESASTSAEMVDVRLPRRRSSHAQLSGCLLRDHGLCG